MRLFSHSNASEQREILASYQLTEQEAEQETQQPHWHCAWCEPYTEGDTSGICPDCEARFFPRRGGAR